MLKPENQTIFIISNEPWGDMWFSKHWYAQELARANKVFFINPCSKWKFLDLFSFSASVEKISENLFVVNYKNNFPVIFLKRISVLLNDFFNSLKILKTAGNIDNIVFWQFDPFRFCDLFFFKNRKRIYHAADQYRGFSLNELIAKKSHLIVCTSKYFVTYYRTLNSNVIHIPHGVSSDETHVDIQEVNQIKNKFKNFLIFVGSLGYRTNFDLLIRVASENININFVLFGPLFLKNENEHNKFEEMMHTENIKYAGVVNGKILKNYIAASQGCLVPYHFNLKSTVSGIASSSLKILNYIAHLKPVITTIDSEIEILDNRIIYKAETEEQFSFFVNKTIHNELLIDYESVKKYIADVNYQKLISKIFQSL